MNDVACSLSPVSGRPYQVKDWPGQWLVYVRSASHSLEDLVEQVAAIIAPTPCAAELRVYGETDSSSHIFTLTSAPEAIPLLDRCEAVGIFQSLDLTRDQHAILQALDNRSRPIDDEACLLRAVMPRPVIFLHPGHQDVDVICGRTDAERLLIHLLQHGYP